MAERTQKALAEFLSEAQETIDALGRDLLRLDAAGAEDPDPELLNAVFRGAHSLKGLSSMFGVERMARLAHALEDVLDDVRLGRRALDRASLDPLLEAPEVFSRIIAEEAAGTPPATADAAARLTDRLRSGAPGGATPAEEPLDAVAIAPEVRAALTEYEAHRLRANVARGVGLFRVRTVLELGSFERELAELTARLRRAGEVVCALPSPAQDHPQAIAFELLVASCDPIETIRRQAGAAAAEPVARLRPVAAPAAEPPGRGVSPDARAEGESASLRSVSQAVRVDIRKLDRLMNVVGELVLAKSSLLSIAERLKAGGGDPVLAAELHRTTRTVDRKLEELQAGILEVRMVPLDQIFEKLARMVRKLAREIGKEVELDVSGGDVELDKLIVEDLSDPLMHLVRNAIDHGIEPPEVRAHAGKPRAGRVSLAAVQRGNHVRIVVEDDGGGIDEEVLRRVAVERRLATPAAIQALPRRDVMNLIFVPGFSTARQVTPLSGRGVGMDVVKNNVASLSGIIDLQTETGRGTRFEITLPVTLAIVRALVVGVAGRTYAVPLSSVLEILEVPERDVRTVSAREVVSVRGTTLPLVRLARLFGHAGASPRASSFVVVVGLAQERLGVAVDEIAGQQDVVVKPLGPALQGVRGIAGATDLGNRRTVLVLDVGAIVEDVVGADPAWEAVG